MYEAQAIRETAERLIAALEGLTLAATRCAEAQEQLLANLDQMARCGHGELASFCAYCPQEGGGR